MEIGIIGAGNIGGNAARRFALGGHGVVLSYSRNPANLDALAHGIGDTARVGTPAEAAACDVVMVSVPWPMIDDAIDRAGSLENKVVIDTTNQFSSGGVVTFPGRGNGGPIQRRPDEGRSLHEVLQHPDRWIPGAGGRSTRPRPGRAMGLRRRRRGQGSRDGADRRRRLRTGGSGRARWLRGDGSSPSGRGRLRRRVAIARSIGGGRSRAPGPADSRDTGVLRRS